MAGRLVLTPVPKEELRRVWPFVLERLDSDPDSWQYSWTKEQLLQELDEDLLRLWFIGNRDGIVGTALTQIRETAAGKLLNIAWALGMEASEWVSVLPELEEYAKGEGCVAVGITNGRPGWQRVMRGVGFKPWQVVLVRPLSTTH